MEKKFQNRREFLTSTVKIAGGTAAMSLMGGLALAEDAPSAPAYPFTYAKLDPEAVKENGYKAFYELGGCAAGAFDALVGALSSAVGYPFTQIPTKMFANGAAGYGAASLCGSLGGCAAAIGLVCEAADSRAIVAELFKWYRAESFPNYDPDGFASKKTVANSVNCADSVTKFMTENGITEMGADNRKARCAAVTAEAAAKTAELLNAHFGL